MKKVRMRRRNAEFVWIRTNDGIIFLTSSSWRARRWAEKMIRHQAAICGLSPIKKNGAYYCGGENASKIEHQLFPQLANCWEESPTSRGKVFGLMGRLDKGF